MSGFRLLRFRGIDIRVNWSVLLVGWLITWSLATSVLPNTSQSGTEASFWIAGVITTIGFFASLIAHEIGHAIEAERSGVGVKSITLWLLGGVALLESKPRSAQAAFRIAMAGPLVSFAIGLVGVGVWSAVGSVSDVAGAAVGWLATMNLIVGVFNLLPAFPLDGGRIYQAWAWSRSGNEEVATRAAARLGVGVGTALMSAGLALIVFVDVISGIWLVAIGWFLRDVARVELVQLKLTGPLRGFSAADVMTRDPQTVAASDTLASFVASLHRTGRHASYPVGGEALVGLISTQDVTKVKSALWAQTPVAEIMTPSSQLLIVGPDTAIGELVDAMRGHGAMRALVVAGGSLVGIIAPSDIGRLLTSVELSIPRDGDGGTATS